mmetsp:Transcript_19924/g.48931  ORF Transcript_19924/g.48931 Transcript_19924/m.48931 type:complete len:224 (-) Transcript_19924:819-1490(-)
MVLHHLPLPIHLVEALEPHHRLLVLRLEPWSFLKRNPTPMLKLFHHSNNHRLLIHLVPPVRMVLHHLLNKELLHLAVIHLVPLFLMVLHHRELLMEPHHLNLEPHLLESIHLRSLTVLQHHHHKQLLPSNTKWFLPKLQHHHLNSSKLLHQLLPEATTSSPTWDLVDNPMANNLKHLLLLLLTSLVVPMETCPLVENFMMQEFSLQPWESCSSSHKSSRIRSF